MSSRVVGSHRCRGGHLWDSSSLPITKRNGISQRIYVLFVWPPRSFVSMKRYVRRSGSRPSSQVSLLRRSIFADVASALICATLFHATSHLIFFVKRMFLTRAHPACRFGNSIKPPCSISLYGPSFRCGGAIQVENIRDFVALLDSISFDMFRRSTSFLFRQKSQKQSYCWLC